MDKDSESSTTSRGLTTVDATERDETPNINQNEDESKEDPKQIGGSAGSKPSEPKRISPSPLHIYVAVGNRLSVKDKHYSYWIWVERPEAVDEGWIASGYDFWPPEWEVFQTFRPFQHPRRAPQSFMGLLRIGEVADEQPDDFYERLELGEEQEPPAIENEDSETWILRVVEALQKDGVARTPDSFISTLSELARSWKDLMAKEDDLAMDEEFHFWIWGERPGVHDKGWYRTVVMGTLSGLWETDPRTQPGDPRPYPKEFLGIVKIGEVLGEHPGNFFSRLNPLRVKCTVGEASRTWCHRAIHALQDDGFVPGALSAHTLLDKLTQDAREWQKDLDSRGVASWADGELPRSCDGDADEA
ncbi:hypothetical protein NA57DRAFT_70701 [Rhizodiscina lignyota]|uniref:Uncharacterized protein n=1 Tax=Rhizodiscina lignyota TaxID=1504668 RepID=A0A9P4IQY6_9PEZI|nr:hypothetical protein NA57DRAFT_70701 [Rhizodiscina lignyota]